MASQHQCRHEVQSLRLKSTARFFFKRPAPYASVMMGGEKSIGKTLLLAGFLSYLDSRTYHTQVVLLGKKWTSIHLPSWWATSLLQTY